MRMPAWARGALLLVAAVAVGVVLGVAYERQRSAAHPTDASHGMMDHLSAQLGLDSAQARQVAAILERRQGVVDSTWHAMRPHVRATMDTTLREIAAVLRPEQVAKLRSMVNTRHPGALH